MSYLNKEINFGGELLFFGEVIKQLQEMNVSQIYIDRYLQGALTREMVEMTR